MNTTIRACLHFVELYQIQQSISCHNMGFRAVLSCCSSEKSGITCISMDCRYEAFVIYTFFALLLEYIGGPGNVETFCRDKTIKGNCWYGTCFFPPMQVCSHSFSVHKYFHHACVSINSDLPVVALLDLLSVFKP